MALIIRRNLFRSIEERTFLHDFRFLFPKFVNRSLFSFYFKLARNLFYSIVERSFLHDFCFLNSLIVPFLFILNWYEIYFTRRKKIFARFSIFVFSKFVNRSHFSFYFKLARNLFYSIERRFLHDFCFLNSSIVLSFLFILNWHEIYFIRSKKDFCTIFDFCFLNSLIVFFFLFILNWHEIYFTRSSKEGFFIDF